MSRFTPASLVLLLALAACAAPQTLAPVAPDLHPAAITHTVVTEEVGVDPTLEGLVAPYRGRLEAEMAEPVAVAVFEITRDGEYESALGNLAADAMLAVAEEDTGERMDFAVGNAGGLRVPLAAGPVTLGHVFELMPFDNYLVVQTMTGVQVDSLAQQLARIGGEPVAGLSLTVTPEGRARDVAIRGEPLDRAATYRVVTHNYLAFGGGDLPELWEPVSREELTTTLRDAFVRYFRALGTLAPEVEGRIRPTP
jgi:2',3'-cyclic-nucleotide 2'-phosphodiesterase (5'-nucleotidase family)